MVLVSVAAGKDVRNTLTTHMPSANIFVIDEIIEDLNVSEFAVVEEAYHGHGIAEYIRRVGDDLVVLGTKGRSNLGYVLLGSTVERLLREIPCSALVVRPRTGNGSKPERKEDDGSAG
jgi:nucleotide-binding universal stress UspA family protein